MLLWFFTATLFVSAWLLFLVQPMLAKMILPFVGGAPEVWNTCMVFFQAALLAGYAYAHLLASRLHVGRQAVIHLGVLLLAAIILPVGVHNWTPPTDSNPVPALLALLVTCAGLPFFAVAATAPLLQRWFASSGHFSANDPYFLYGASNAGSVLALLSYPAFLEPSLRLADQSRIWTAGYVLLIILIGGCAALVSRSRHRSAMDTPLSPPGRGAEGEGPPCEREDASGDEGEIRGQRSEVRNQKPEGTRAPTVLRRLRWIALAFVPSSLMLGVTTHITTDIAPVPLLWIMPLTLYLLSFILAFARLPRWVHVLMLCLLPTTILVLVLARSTLIDLKITQVIALHLATFFVAAMVCHGELAHSRPATPYLTEFYLWVALGGVLGGVFNALVAPQVFDRVVEYPLAIVLPCFLLLRVGRRPDTLANEQNTGISAGRGAGYKTNASIQFGGLSWAWFVFGVVMGTLLLPDLSFPAERILYLGRTFFGVLRVQASADGNFHDLLHGRILHGTQSMDPKMRLEPLSYYDRAGPVGQVFKGIRGLGRRKFGVVGLGTGTIAAYAEPGAELTFFEIDPAIERVARDPRYFTYLTDCERRHVKLNIVLGDARLQMEKADQGFGLIVLDAFSSDAIPVHTLTREAFQMYLSKLSDDGVILINVTNRYLDLAPVIGGQARDANLTGLHQNDAVDYSSLAVYQRKRQSSHWAVLARRPDYLGELTKDGRWEPLSAPTDKPAWSDDFSNLLGVFRWEASEW